MRNRIIEAIFTTFSLFVVFIVHHNSTIHHVLFRQSPSIYRLLETLVVLFSSGTVLAEDPAFFSIRVNSSLRLPPGKSAARSSVVFKLPAPTGQVVIPSADIPVKLLPQLPVLPVTGTTQVAVRNVNPLIQQLLAGQTRDFSWPFASANPPRYIAIGGSLTAGFRNGGLYREVQLTAYPNWLAQQMGLSDFQSPLFSASQENGTGYKKLTSENPLPRYANVTNDVALVGSDPLTLTPYTTRIDNLGLPFMGISTAYASEEWRYSSSVIPDFAYELISRSFLRRFLPEDNRQWSTNYVSYLKKQTADFYTVELGMDDLIWYASAGGYRLDGLFTLLGSPEGNAIIDILAHTKAQKAKAIVSTVPDILRFPYYHMLTMSQLRQRIGTQKLYVVDNDVYDIEPGNQEHVIEVTDDMILLPTANVLGLFEGQKSVGFSKTAPLTSRDVLSSREITMVKSGGGINDIVRLAARQNNVPLVDLQAIYNQILNGTYVTDDGVAIDPSFPRGNFFSDDGLSPTALGQAVLANEWIKAINSAYQTKIPLIATQQVAALLPR